METITKKTVTNLDTESVSILTQEVYYTTEKQMQYETKEQDGVEMQVPVEIDVEVEHQIGSNHRCAYSNTESGRAMLTEKEPEDIVAEVMAVWGDAPTVEEFKFDENYVPEPTAEERITQLEEQVATHEDNDAELLYQICLLQLGVEEDAI